MCPYAATKKRRNFSLIHIHPSIAFPQLVYDFSLYGPWGRPDMGVFKFVANIVDGKTIDIYNNGNMRRNFTYIDDIVSGIITCIDATLPSANIMNIGGDRDEALMDYIAAVEKHANKRAKKNMMPMQQGDVQSTVADIRKLRKLGWKPTTRIDKGVQNFVAWYQSYYHTTAYTAYHHTPHKALTACRVHECCHCVIHNQILHANRRRQIHRFQMPTPTERHIHLPMRKRTASAINDYCIIRLSLRTCAP